MNEACRTTRHCADHGWCNRCDPAFAKTMSTVNAAIQRTEPDPQRWGRMYSAIGKALRADSGATPAPSGPCGSIPGDGPACDWDPNCPDHFPPPVPADRADLRDPIASAISKWHRDPEQPLYTQGADAVLAVLPTLTETERAMLRYALDRAQEQIWSEGGFTNEDQAAVTSLRRIAGAETQQPGEKR